VKGRAVVDGTAVPLEQAVIPVTDPGFTLGYTVFETFAWPVPGTLAPHWRRLRRSAALAGMSCPVDEVLSSDVAALGLTEGSWRVRMTLTGAGRRVVVATPLDRSRRFAPVRVITRRAPEHVFMPGEVKHGSRAGWHAAVKASGVDDILMVDAEGRFTEGTTCGVLAVVDGVLLTAPHDGRILRSTTVSRLLGHAERLQIPVRRQGARWDGPLDALYVASSTRSIAPVVELNGAALPGWDPIGRRLMQEESGDA